jgi:pseudouridine synthase
MKKNFDRRKGAAASPGDASSPDTVRLQKFLADAGLCSRRGGAELVESGRVIVDGAAPESPGMRIDPNRAKVVVDGHLVRAPRKKHLVYIALNKPRGYVTTMDDPEGRKTVADLLRGVRERVVPVGRLDRDSEGLLLFTNDGDLVYRLTHPKFEIEKEYLVTVNGVPGEEALDGMRRGVDIEGQVTLPAGVKLLEVRPGAGPEGTDVSLMSVTLREGRKRQVRRMCEAVGLEVRRLMRAREGVVELGDLKLGGWRPLKLREINALKKETGLG